jgi:hypothetical protein
MRCPLRSNANGMSLPSEGIVFNHQASKYKTTGADTRQIYAENLMRTNVPRNEPAGRERPLWGFRIWAGMERSAASRQWTDCRRETGAERCGRYRKCSGGWHCSADVSGVFGNEG